MARINIENDKEVEAYLDKVAKQYEGIESTGIVTPLWDAWKRVEKARPWTSYDSQKVYFCRDR